MVECVAERVGAGRAGCCWGEVWAAEVVAHGDVSGGEVDEEAGDEEGGDAAVARGVVGDRGVVDVGEAADAGAEDDAGVCAGGVGRRVVGCVKEGFGGGGDGVLGEEGHAAFVGGGEVLTGGPAAGAQGAEGDEACYGAWQLGKVRTVIEGGDAAVAFD